MRKNLQMKKLIIIVFVFLVNNIANSQSKDLLKLAKGDFLGMNAVFDSNENLYGYVSVYGYGKSSETTKKFEYVILDKNLNPVANKEFEGDITVGDYFAYMDFKGQIILQPSSLDYSIKLKNMFTPSSMVIDVEKNEVKKKIHYDYDGNNFIEISQPKNWKDNKKEDKAEKKQKGYNYISRVYEIKEGGFLVSEFHDYEKYVNNNSLIRFDDNKKEIWKYKYNTSGDKKNKEILNVIEKDENYIYAFLETNSKREKSFNLLVLDIKTGQEVHNESLSEPNSTVLDYILYLDRIDNIKNFDDNIVILGRDFKKGNVMQSIGFVRLIIDKKTFKIETKHLSYENQLSNYIPKLDNYGGVEGAYILIPKDVFFLKNGSMGILMEKYKPQGQYSASKTTDLVYIYTNKDFSVNGVQVFEKEKTKWFHSDYLFSQYLNDGKDVVFFYKDRQKDEDTKEKNWNLFINTLIDGKFNQEIVPISSKENIIFPYVAKEGFILLQEFNKKEKYNNVRLERLNY